MSSRGHKLPNAATEAYQKVRLQSKHLQVVEFADYPVDQAPLHCLPQTIPQHQRRNINSRKNKA